MGVPFLQVKANDFLKQAVLNIISILTNPLSTNSITLATGDEIQSTLLEISYALKRIEQLPSLPNGQPTNKLNDNKKEITQSPTVTEKQDYTHPPRMVDETILNIKPKQTDFTKNPVQLPRVVNKPKNCKQGSNPYKK